MSKYAAVLKELGQLYLYEYQIKDIEEYGYGTYEWFVPKAMMQYRGKTHPKGVCVVHNDYDLTDPDNYIFVFTFNDKLYGFYYFDNSDSMPEIVEDSFKEFVAKDRVVTVYE